MPELEISNIIFFKFFLIVPQFFFWVNNGYKQDIHELFVSALTVIDTGFRGRGAGKGRHTTVQEALYGRLMAGNSNCFPYTYSNYVNDKHICQGLLLKAV